MSQIRVLTEQEIRGLLQAVCVTGRPAVVDWTNHKIEVLSEEKVNNSVQLSDGPMTYRDILFQINKAGVISNYVKGK